MPTLALSSCLVCSTMAAISSSPYFNTSTSVPVPPAPRLPLAEVDGERCEEGAGGECEEEGAGSCARCEEGEVEREEGRCAGCEGKSGVSETDVCGETNDQHASARTHTDTPVECQVVRDYW